MVYYNTSRLALHNLRHNRTRLAKLFLPGSVIVVESLIVPFVRLKDRGLKTRFITGTVVKFISRGLLSSLTIRSSLPGGVEVSWVLYLNSFLYRIHSIKK